MLLEFFYVEHLSQNLYLNINNTNKNMQAIPNVLMKFRWIHIHTVKSAYKEPAYKELPVIRNWFLFSNPYQETISLYIYKELWL